jgi:hypothetical protein
MARRAHVSCPDNGESGSVVWYPGTDDSTLFTSFCAACRIDPLESVDFVENPKGNAMFEIFGSTIAKVRGQSVTSTRSLNISCQ